MGVAYCRERRANAGAGTEAQRGFKMLDRDVGLVRPNPENAADVPATREARVEREGAVNQPYQGADVLGEMTQGKGGIRQDAWIVAGRFQGSPGEIHALKTVRRRILAAAVCHKPKTAERGPDE